MNDEKRNVSMQTGPGPLAGAVSAPPSKSLLHRALICAALAGKPEAVEIPQSVSDDIEATIRVMRALFSRGAVCDCGESGTTLRLALPIAAALGVETVFAGSGRLPMRPMKPYLEAFRGSGAVLEPPAGASGASLPMRTSGRLRPGVYTVPGDVSSQFVSGLLLALPLLDGDSRIAVSGELQSRPYVDMTVRSMKDFGVVAECDGSGGFIVPGRQRYAAPADRVSVECDASQEAFWLLARFIGSGDLEISGLSPDRSLQGDAVFSSLLAELENSRTGTQVPEMDVSQIPDLVPALAVAGAFSPRGLRIVHGERLRLKESDRLATTSAMLRALGCRAGETPDGLVVMPDLARAGSGRGAAAVPVVDGAGDHRIVMAAAVAATRVPCIISGAQAVAKSYPSFFAEYRRLGGRAVPLDT